MKKTQIWRPDTHENLLVLQEVDTETGEIRSRGVVENGVIKMASAQDRLTPAEEKKFSAILHTKRVDDAAGAIADEVTALNQHKNLVIIPALLAALPADEKIIQEDEHGGEPIETFKNPPEFRAVDGEIVADLSHIKPASRAAALAVMESKKRRGI